MRAALLATVVIALAVAGSSAQDAGHSQQTCAIAGTVVDGVTQQPLKDAVVSVRALPATGSPSKALSVSTDATGRFSFESLAPGRFMLTAAHDGYVNRGVGGGLARGGFGLRGELIDLAPGQQIDDLVLPLIPDAVITGHISNAAGKPMPGVTLQAMRNSYRFGKPQLYQVASVRTNKAGEYGITALPPGKYYLRALSTVPPVSKPGSSEAYVPTYYPGTSDRARAVALPVRPGEELGGIDVTLTPVRTVVVRGRVVDARASSPGSGAEVTLVDEEGGIDSSPYETAADAKGSFELRGIPPGYYILMAQRPSRSDKDQAIWGRKTVHVGEVNVQDAVVVISPGVDISGRIRVDGKTNVDLSHLTGILEPSENLAVANFMPDVGTASVKPDGSFVFHEIPEGSYRIRFSPIPASFYMKSSAGDVLETGITIARGQSLSGLEFTLSPGAPRVKGTVRKDQQPAAGVFVVLIPDSDRRGEPDYYRQSVTDLQGRFTLRSVPPGDYEIFAWEEIERAAYMDPDFLQQFEDLGKAVRLKEGDDLNLQLEVIPASE